MPQGNSHIGCNVTECRHHAKTVQQCSLSHIEVVKHGATATTKESTDCGSFERA
ncbi:DUF1540 domain-containing protein [Crassaminicella thermophila]|uniref:DUF1540 domain-containing protein n=1 Tax=Crassaminicella thermophila TaxID=2599308 RepID=A0A5C0SJD5_CRATE|nr:DUF1540 domain-containing protein [Crassaminicella thermophila]QEK13338.1 DUF1540 domain-containing protein [Crassaminicella thermophila]